MSSTLDDALADPIAEGPLTLLPAKRPSRTQPDDVPTPETDELPVVSVGRPRAWPLHDLIDHEALSPEIRGSLDRTDFFIVRLACSFRPRTSGVSIAWARFAVHLEPDPGGREPLAFDLYPRVVERERQVGRHVTLSPSLKFSEIEASAGEVGYTVEYQALDPVLSAAGFEEPTPSWDFSATPHSPVHGGKLMHAVIAAPAGLERLALLVKVTADLNHRGFRLPAWLGKSHATRDHISCTVWPQNPSPGPGR